MNRCFVTFELLMDYREGRADATTQARVRTHLDAGCDDCRERLAWLEAALPTLHAALTEAETPAPESLVAYARDLFRERTRAPERPSIRQVLARLLFDSRNANSPALAGMRAVSEGSRAYQCLYETEAYLIDLWEEHTPDDRSYLIGQAYSKSDNRSVLPESVVLTTAENDLLNASMEANEFHLPSVSSGTYQLRLRFPDEEILLNDVTVGS